MADPEKKPEAASPVFEEVEEGPVFEEVKAPTAPKQRAMPDDRYGDVKHSGASETYQWEPIVAGAIRAIPGATKLAARVHSWVDPSTSYDESLITMEAGNQQTADLAPVSAAIGEVAGNVALGSLLPGGVVARGAGFVKQLAGTAALTAAQSLDDQGDISLDRLPEVAWQTAKDTAKGAAAHAAGAGVIKGVQKMADVAASTVGPTIKTAVKNIADNESIEQLRKYGFSKKELKNVASKEQVIRELKAKAANTSNVKEAAEYLTKADRVEKAIPATWIKDNIRQGSWREMEDQAASKYKEASQALGTLLKATDEEYGKIVQGAKIIRPQIFKNAADELRRTNPTHGQQKVLAPLVKYLDSEAEAAVKAGGYSLDQVYQTRSALNKKLIQLNSGAAPDKELVAEYRATVDVLDDIIEGHITRLAPNKKAVLDDLRLEMAQADMAKKAFNSKIVEKLPRWSSYIDDVKDYAISKGASIASQVERKLRTGGEKFFGKHAETLAAAMRKGTLAQTVYLLTRQDPDFAEKVRKGTTKDSYYDE